MDSTGPMQEVHPHSDSLCDTHHPGHLTQSWCLTASDWMSQLQWHKVCPFSIQWTQDSAWTPSTSQQGLHLRASPLKLCWFFSPPSFNHPLDGKIMNQAHDFHGVSGLQDVHTRGHFQNHLLLPEISFTSTTGPQGCRDTVESQPLSWPCPKQGLLSLWVRHFSLTLPVATPSSIFQLWSKSFAHTRSWALGIMFLFASLLSAQVWVIVYPWTAIKDRAVVLPPLPLLGWGGE